MGNEKVVVTIADPAVISGVFIRDAVANISRRLNEPEWMLNRRLVAWDVFVNTPMPSIKDEDWRRTSLKSIKWEQLRLADKEMRPVEKFMDLPKSLRKALGEGNKAAGRLAIMNGKVIYNEVSPEVARKGVIYTNIHTALRENGNLVEKYFMTEVVPPADGKFAALNGAYWQDGAFLYVPREVEVDAPFYSLIVTDESGFTSFPRTLIICELFSSVSLMEETYSPDNKSQTLNSGVVEIVAGEASQIQFGEVQRWGKNVINFNTMRAAHRADSHVAWNTAQLGARLTKTYIDNILAGNGSSMEFNGVYLLDGNQHMDLDSLMRHTGIATSGDLLLHGALRDNSRAVFQGLIKIDPSGQQTNSYLKNDNLLLSDAARADSLPSLQIDANDVRASHGATVGKIDEEYVFYLMSRGIQRSDAEKMIVEGFFSTVIDRIKKAEFRNRFIEAVEKKWDE